MQLALPQGCVRVSGVCQSFLLKNSSPMAGEPRLPHLVLERSGSDSGAAGGAMKAHEGGQRKARQRRVLAGSSRGTICP